MRVLSCKIHCPPICFCKPSSHFCTPSPLKLENTPHVAPPPPPPPLISPPTPPHEADTSLEEGQAATNSNVNANFNGSVNFLKSSLRKPSHESSLAEKKNVQWVDVLGQELAEIKEFQSSDDEGRMDFGGCVCTIM